ncbi:AUGMIN subunit 8-like [Nymphaea colorata]|nr:AUGMIN subunit 8-like [Nymphaea colorata]
MTSAQSQQFSVADSEHRPPLVPSDKNSNGVASRKPRTREVSSRYKSSLPFSSSSSSSLATTPTVPSLSRRCPSPSISRASPLPDPKRAQSVERRRTSSPSRPTTPVHDSKLNNGLSDSKRFVGRSPESLWPSTRSLCVSFQADSFTLPITKRERPVSHSTDRTLAPSANRQCDSPVLQRKATPERKRTPLRGKNADPSENSKPLDNCLSRKIDHHRWPGRSLVKGDSLNRSVDLSDKTSKAAALLVQAWGARSDAIGRGFQQSVNEGNFATDRKRVVRRMSFDGTAEHEISRTLNLDNLHLANSRHLQTDNTSHDADPASPDCCLRSSDSSSGVDSVSTGSDLNVEEQIGDPRNSNGRASTARGIVVPARFWQETNNRVQRTHPRRYSTPERDSASGTLVGSQTVGRPKQLLSNPPERSSSNPRSSRTQSLPASPNKSLVTSSPSRGFISPSRVRSGTSPSTNTIASRTSNSSSILNFMVDVRRGKKGLNQLEDAHHLRLLHNRYLQWRFVNARADAALAIQHVAAEDLLHNVYMTTSGLRHCVTLKRIKVQQLRRDISFYLILKEQIPYLDEWALTEKEHSSSLSAAIEALEASTIRLPITDGAKADIEAVRDAIMSAAEVIQAMGSPVPSLLSKAEDMNDLISELADTTLQARALINKCRDLLSKIAAIQVEECSHRTHLMQLKRAITDEKQTNLAVQGMV